jgi:hypothetical protein
MRSNNQCSQPLRIHVHVAATAIQLSHWDWYPTSTIYRDVWMHFHFVVFKVWTSREIYYHIWKSIIIALIQYIPVHCPLRVLLLAYRSWVLLHSTKRERFSSTPPHPPKKTEPKLKRQTHYPRSLMSFQWTKEIVIASFELLKYVWLAIDPTRRLVHHWS